MTILLLTLALALAVPCDQADTTQVAEATARASVFDLAGAAERLSGTTVGCPMADVALAYLRGLLAAREAYELGGPPESLDPVRAAIEVLDTHTLQVPAAAIARAVLQAARAAAQSERDEMALFLEHAVELERLQQAAGEPGLAIITAHEVAGDLWLQVHRYEDARRAYVLAAGQVGATARVALGLARAAAQLDDLPAACGAYAMLGAGTPQDHEASEFAEARAFLDRAACRRVR
jgi:hypothetical protein